MRDTGIDDADSAVIWGALDEVLDPAIIDGRAERCVRTYEIDARLDRIGDLWLQRLIADIYVPIRETVARFRRKPGKPFEQARNAGFARQRHPRDDFAHRNPCPCNYIKRRVILLPPGCGECRSEHAWPHRNGCAELGNPGTLAGAINPRAKFELSRPETGPPLSEAADTLRRQIRLRIEKERSIRRVGDRDVLVDNLDVAAYRHIAGLRTEAQRNLAGIGIGIRESGTSLHGWSRREPCCLVIHQVPDRHMTHPQIEMETVGQLTLVSGLQEVGVEIHNVQG